MLAVVTGELDLSRLTELEELLGSDLAQIVETLVTELESAIRGVAEALGRDDLPAAALAAHAARNSALMINSRLLLERLDALERSARREDLDGARSAQGHLAEEWPAVRAQLQRAGGLDPDVG
jgi:hypothetical protein